MGKSKKEKRQAYFFDNKTLLALILPLVVEQLLAVLVGMADSIMIASVGEGGGVGSIVGRSDYGAVDQCIFSTGYGRSSRCGAVPGTGQTGRSL